MITRLVAAIALAASVFTGSVGAAAESALPTTFGAHPTLAEPKHSLIPTINIAPAIGWQAGAMPVSASDFIVQPFAKGLDHPRWIYVLPNGDVLVAETNEPPKPDDGKGLRGMAMRLVMKRAGAGVPSANRIMLLRGMDENGVAKSRTVFLQNLNSPFGITLVGHDLYVANTDAVVRFPYTDGATSITTAGVKVADLPAGRINHHWTKNIIASKDGKQLYVTVGSNSNVGENGMQQEERRAAILEIDLASGQSRVFASGLRNPNGMGWEPHTGALWTAVNERDEIGDDLVPDYMTSVKEGAFYGWPYSYYGQHVDTRIQPQRPELVAAALAPDYALGAHSASLGLAFYEGALLPAHYRGGVFIGQHGSWNRSPRSGYKVIFVPFADGHPSGPPEDILSGFVNDEGEAMGRPVGVAVDRSGALLVADDVGNTIWRLVPSPKAVAPK